MKSFFHSPLKIIAEQGGCSDLPKNSFESYQKSIDNGADAVSVLVRSTKDREIVICEDEELSRYTDGRGKISDFTYSEINKLDAAYFFKDNNNEEEFRFRGKGYRIHLLEDALKEFPETRFVINLMDDNISYVKDFAKLIQKLGAEERILLSSPYGKNLKVLKEILPDVPVNFSLMGIVGVYALFRSGLINFKNSFNADVIITSENMGTSYIASRGFVRTLKEKGCMVYVRPLAKEVSIKRVLSAGVDGIITDDVALVEKIMYSN